MKFRRILSVFLLTALLTVLCIPGAAALEPISVNARAAQLVDTADDTILYGKNETTRMYPASITKVMTAMLILEAVDRGQMQLDQVITAAESAFVGLDPDGSSAEIEPGEQMSVESRTCCTACCWCRPTSRATFWPWPWTAASPPSCSG